MLWSPRDWPTVYLLRSSVFNLRFRLHSVTITAEPSSEIGDYSHGTPLWFDDESFTDPIGLQFKWAFSHEEKGMLLRDPLAVQSSARFLNELNKPLSVRESAKVLTQIVHGLDWRYPVAVACGLMSRKDFE